MRVACEQCGAVYRIDSAKLSDSGVKIRCRKCKHVFVATANSAAPADSAEASAPAGSEPSYIVRSAMGDPIGRLTETQLSRRASSGQLVGSEEISSDGEQWRPVKSLGTVNEALAAAMSSAETMFGIGPPDDLPAASDPAQTTMGMGAQSRSGAAPADPPPLPDFDDLDLALPSGAAADGAAAEVDPPAPASGQLPDLNLPESAGDPSASASPAAGGGFDDFDFGGLDLPQPKGAEPPAGDGGGDDLDLEFDDLTLPEAKAADDIGLPTPDSASQPAAPPRAASSRKATIGGVGAPSLELADLDLPSPSPSGLAPPPASGGPSGLFDLDESELPAPSSLPPTKSADRAPSLAGPAPGGLDDLDLVAPQTGGSPLGPPGPSPADPHDSQSGLDLDRSPVTSAPAAKLDLGEPPKPEAPPPTDADIPKAPAIYDGARQAVKDGGRAARAETAKKILLYGGGSVCAAILVLGLVANFVTDHGFFFYYLITGQPVAERSGAVGLLQQARKEIGRDTPANYNRAVQLCDEAIQRAPSYGPSYGVRASARLAMVYRYGANPAYTTAAEQDLASIRDSSPEAVQERETARALQLLVGAHALPALEALDAQDVSGQTGAAFWLIHGWANRGAKRLLEARADFEKALQIDPQFDAAAYELATVLHEQGKTAEATNKLQELLKRNPNHLASVLELGVIAWRAGDADKARGFLKRIFKSGAKVERARALAILGQLALKEGNLAGAEGHFKEASALDPSNIEALVGLGTLLYESSKPSEAFTACQKAQLADALNTEAGLCVVRSALLLARNLDARIGAEAIIRRNPEHAEAYLLLGRAADAFGEWSEAQEHYTKALQLKPDYFDPYLYMARQYIDRGRFREARDMLRGAGTNVGKIAPYHSGLGEVYLAEGKLGQARAEFTAAIRKDPNFHEARFRIAGLIAEEGDLSEAVKQFERLRERASGFPGLSEKLGLLYFKMGRQERALQELERALAVEYPSHSVRLAAAEVFADVGRYNEVQEQAGRVLKDRPNDAHAHYLMGLGMLGLKQLTASIGEFQSSINAKESPLAFFALGRALEESEKAHEALKAYASAVRLDPRFLAARIKQAGILTQIGSYSAALAEYKTVGKESPDRADVMLAAGNCALRLADRRGALRYFEEAVRRDPKLAEAHFKIGQQLHDKGRVRDALKSLKRSVSLARSDEEVTWLPDAYNLLGYAYRDLGERTEAITTFRQYLAANPDAPDRDEIMKELSYLGAGK